MSEVVWYYLKVECDYIKMHIINSRETMKSLKHKGKNIWIKETGMVAKQGQRTHETMINQMQDCKCGPNYTDKLP